MELLSKASNPVIVSDCGVVMSDGEVTAVHPPNRYYTKGGSGVLAFAMQLLSKSSNPVTVSSGSVVRYDGVVEVVQPY